MHWVWDAAGSTAAGYPIRTSPDQRLLAAPRSLSQLATSFIAGQNQGIHRTALSSLTTRELLGETHAVVKERTPPSRPIHAGRRVDGNWLRTRSGQSGGPERDRTADLLNANQALSQLSYRPKLMVTGRSGSRFKERKLVGRTGIAPVTPALSARCSTN